MDAIHVHNQSSVNKLGIFFLLAPSVVFFITMALLLLNFGEDAYLTAAKSESSVLGNEVELDK